MLDEAANWIKDDGSKTQIAEPPPRVLCARYWRCRATNFPNLRGIAHAPFFDEAGGWSRRPVTTRQLASFSIRPGWRRSIRLGERPSAEHVQHDGGLPD